jgi:hypothetical protein
MASMPSLNHDVIHHIIVMISSERDSQARLAVMSLLSRSCTPVAQPYLFQSIMVQNNLRCHRLLEIFESNPKLVTYVTELEMVDRVGYDGILQSRNNSFFAKQPAWYMADEGGKLLGLLPNVAHLAIHGDMLCKLQFDVFLKNCVRARTSQLCHQPAPSARARSRARSPIEAVVSLPLLGDVMFLRVNPRAFQGFTCPCFG